MLTRLFKTHVWLVAAVVFSLTADLSQAGEVNQLSESEKKAGWQLLFDGESLDQWRNYKQDGLSEGWQIKDGALVRAAGGAGDIITKQKYSEFELSIDYKISKGGNSGIMFHVTEDGKAPWHSGPEIQVQDNVDGHDPQKAGWLYQLYSSNTDATKPAGEWNNIRLLISDNGCEIQMNGVRYARFKLGSGDWKRKVAASKFAKYEGFGSAGSGHICLQDHGNLVSYRNIKIRELDGGKVPNPVDGASGFKAAPAFPNLKWTGWNPISEQGKVVPLRPIVITNAGDGSNRLFVATQRGVVHAFAADQAAQATKVYLDISDRVAYSDRQNEEGLLGLAFHPDYKSNGQLFVYYTTKQEPQLSIISRFTVSKNDPNRALADSEQEVMRIKQPFWNHNGGTIKFGPDGYLYVGLGDGGSANDPLGNGQNLGTLLGSILRIDVDQKTAARPYGIPDDNPHVGRKGARPEIWANGLRNVWRMSFDRQTGQLWAADVGQNLYEEINLIERGGNYGWNLREGMHPFGSEGSEESDELIEPIWEYDHGVGKSITGGVVYRGKRHPELNGYYLYADYVSGLQWALKYDEQTGDVVNKSIASDKHLAIISYGEDEAGEVYFSIVAPDGKGLFRLEQTH